MSPELSQPLASSSCIVKAAELGTKGKMHVGSRLNNFPDLVAPDVSLPCRATELIRNLCGIRNLSGKQKMENKNGFPVL